MKNYEKPVVMINEDLAEGVYAASGTGVDCWIIDKDGETTNFVESDTSREFQFDAHHYSIQVNHVPNAVWVVTFNQPILSVVSCSGYRTTIEGSTVKVYEEHINNMNENEKWGFALRVSSENMSTLLVDNSYIMCP